MMLPELLDFRGRVGRARFGLTVILGRLILHNVYRILAAALAPYRRGGWDYLALLNRPQAMSHDVKVLLWKAALVTLPFLWVLIATTIKRLRDLETTEWFVFLLLIPAVNVLFFLLLCLQPGCEMQDEAEKRGAGVLGSMLPSSKWGSAVVGAFVGANAGALLSSFSILLLGSYGSTLFLAVPFFMGYIAAWLHGYRQPRSAGESLAVAAGSVALAGALIVGIAFEGIICVAMAAPLAIPLALLGGSAAHATQKARHLQSQQTVMMSLFLIIPLLASADAWQPSLTPAHTVHSSIEIAASPEVVWQRVVAFPPIVEKPHWVLRLGMAYPLEAKTVGTGLSADRQCLFSTGISREPILAWEEGKHFAFRISEEPPLMKESSPYGEIQVRHLEDHDFRPGRVDFHLTESSGGRTRLDCSSSYENRMWPAGYWQLWTDEIVRQIQLRVFRHIKKLAEADQRLRVSN